jgi:YcxB-like protein
VHITVSFTPDLRRSRQVTRRLRRRVLRALRVAGVVMAVVAALAAVGGSVGGAVVLALLAVLLFFEGDVVVWWQVRASWEVLSQPVDMTITDEGISQATATSTAVFGWPAIRRVIEDRDYWIFVVSRFQRLVLRKALLSPAQQAELGVFLAARSDRDALIGG